ncbi:MAG: ATP-binding protein [Pseudomonadota bacterium]
MLKSIRWKVVASLLLSVSIPIGASIYFFNKGVIRAYSVALNKEVEDALRTSVEAQRDVFNLWKEKFRLTAKMHASGRALEAAVLDPDREHLAQVLSLYLEEEQSLISAAVTDENDEAIGSSAKDTEAFPDSEWRKMDITVPVMSEERTVNLVETYAVRWEPFRRFDGSGKTLQTFETSLRTKEDITGLYNSVYIFLVGCSVLIALLIASLYARGFSLRIKKIARAAASVGKGNLDIAVNDASGDEVGELGRDFDKMVLEIRESRERINYLQKVSAWQEIARRIAHEIKNPLTPIQLSIQQMKSKYSGDDEQYRKLLEDSAQIAQEEIDALRRLVTEFSSFARLPGVKPAACDLCETLGEIVGGMETLCSDKGVELETRFPREDVSVKLDRMMFKRVVDNLVINALEAIERAGGKDGLIVVEAEPAGDGRKAVIRIMDSGEGISDEDRGRIFLPYFTKRKGGTGLGLAIAKKIILEHEGNIELTECSARGGEADKAGLTGACFTIELPIIPKRG